MTELPPEVLEAARQQVRAEISHLQEKIRAQKRELRSLGRAHQLLWLNFREQNREKASWIKSWQEGNRHSGVIGEEVRRLRGWDLLEYSKWVSGLKWE